MNITTMEAEPHTALLFSNCDRGSPTHCHRERRIGMRGCVLNMLHPKYGCNVFRKVNLAFKPIRDIPLSMLAYKVVFLAAITSARVVFELVA